MAYLTIDSINAWLASTKYTVNTVEPVLEDTVVESGFARVSLRYATTSWIDTASTPSLVLSALSMLYAAWFLQRQISDDEMTDQDYPIRLEARAWALLDSIGANVVDLPGVDPDPALAAVGQPLFFPTDTSTSLWEADEADPEGSPRAFTMGAIF